ncbi:hypothetical protein K438DRAFT_1811466 [Mycena galopus ATCC 62051]|nr:hypothetical protein K438DRAFT_1811466 [Mycena galopus ATCC 62051]
MTHDISFYVKDWEAPIFNADPAEDVSLWIDAIRDGLAQWDVPHQHWVSVAFHFLGEDSRTVLKEQMMGEVELAAGLLDWDTFTRALIHIDEQVKKRCFGAGNQFQQGWRYNLPSETAARCGGRCRLWTRCVGRHHPCACGRGGRPELTRIRCLGYCQR